MSDSHLRNAIRLFQREGIHDEMTMREAAGALTPEQEETRAIRDLEYTMVCGKSLPHRIARYKMLLKERDRRDEAEDEEAERYLEFLEQRGDQPILTPYGDESEGFFFHLSALHLEIFYPTRPAVPS